MGIETGQGKTINAVTVRRKREGELTEGPEGATGMGEEEEGTVDLLGGVHP